MRDTLSIEFDSRPQSPGSAYYSRRTKNKNLTLGVNLTGSKESDMATVATEIPSTAKEIDSTKPRAMAIPKEGYFELEKR